MSHRDLILAMAVLETPSARKRRLAASSAQTLAGVDPLAWLLEVGAEPEVVLDLDEEVG